MSKNDDIVAQAREYVNAVRLYDDVSNYINSLKTTGVARLLNAQDQDERDRISHEQQQHIVRSTNEAIKRISPPIHALNDLIEPDDGPVYFEHNGREWMVVPRESKQFSYREFDVRPRDGGPETAL